MVQRALAVGVTADAIDRAMEMGLSLKQAEQLIARAEAAQKGEFYTPDQQEYIERVKQGRYHLEWLTDKRPQWGVKAERRDSRRGLTLMDINREFAGDAEDAPEGRSMAARGSTLDIDTTYPDMGYIYNNKYQVWSDNVVPLYEEAVQRQWSATRDIPWETLQPLPDDLERAQCQISTFLTEVEMIASDFPAKWLWRMNQHFHEVKMFLCTQAMDEARHLEVFRKRALANGGGLLRCRADTEMGLASILLAPTYIQGSFLMHVGGEGLVLDIFRAGEFLAQNKCEKEIYRLCMQDEARHVSYGTMHLKYFLEHHPDRAEAEEELHVVADAFEPGAGWRTSTGAWRR
ncbi:ferritin-like domain-containing protein [bacterium]|nr:MAG: ferritin-like domain-containing protein [bacterium]